jgi:RNA recognition motif-containing protein
MGTRLFVGNLSYDTTEMSLRELFGQTGTVAEAKIVLDRETGRPRGFAFVQMGSEADAKAAIAALDGKDLDGRTLRVNEAQDRPAGNRTFGGERSGGRRY